jgi:hypothetical protein
VHGFSVPEVRQPGRVFPKTPRFSEKFSFNSETNGGMRAVGGGAPNICLSCTCDTEGQIALYGPHSISLG